MPRSKRPELTRTKATRSRCAGSMLACTLNTTPVNLGSSGCTSRCSAVRGPGGGACSTSASSTSCTPKLLMAEPKNTGVCLPARNCARSKAGAASLISSISPLACSKAEPKRRPISGLDRPSMKSSLSERRSWPARNTRMRSRRMSNTPPKALPMPTGHENGTASMPRCPSISDSSSSGSRTSRSILLMKVMMGVLRARQTCSSRMVCGSTPLAASITMSAASTAVSTR